MPIEDAEQGRMVEPEQKPDLDKAVADMKERGFTRSQVEGVMSTIPVNDDIRLGILERFNEEPLEGGRAVTEERKPDFVIEDGIITPANMMRAVGEQPQFDLSSAMPPEVGHKIQTTPEASQELATIISGVTDTSRQEILESLLGGDTGALDAAMASVSITSKAQALEEGEAALQEAGAEDVEAILERTQQNIDKATDMLDLKENYIRNNQRVADKWLPNIRGMVESQTELADMAQRRAMEIWKNTSAWEVLGDFGELIIPFIGSSEEEFSKFRMDVSEALDAVYSAGTPEQQAEVLDQILDAWVLSETALLENNNSIMNATQIDTLANAIREGGALLREGKLTKAEVEEHVWTAINLGLGSTWVAGIRKGFIGLTRWLTSRIIPDGSDTTRTSGSGVKSEHKLSPEAKLQDEQEKGLSGLARDSGLTPEQLAMELVPTPTPITDPGLANIIKSRTQLNTLVMADETLPNMAAKRAAILEKETGGSLQVMDSGTGIGFLPSDADDSFGTFVFLMSNGDKGFDTASEAIVAGSTRMLGRDWKAVEREGKWFLEVPMKYEFDPALDVLAPTGVAEKARSAVANFFLDPLRVLGKEAMEGLFALKSKNRKIAAELENDMKDAFKGINPTEAAGINKALIQGDADEVVYGSVNAFAEVAGLTTAQAGKAFEAYRKFMSVQDKIFEIRNFNFYNAKNRLGYKAVGDGDDAQLGVRVFGKDIESDEIYSPEYQRFIPKSQITDQHVVMRMDNAVPTSKGDWNYVLVSPEKVKALPHKLLTKRKGHIDRMYRDTGWIVKQVDNNRLLNGRPVAKSTVTHIVKNYTEARRIADAQLPDKEGVKTIVQRSRENDDMDIVFGDEDSVQFGYGSIHTRSRGELLQGSDGHPAPVLNAFQSLDRAVAGIERQLDVDILKSMESMFLKQFKDVLKRSENTRFSSDLKSMLSETGLKRIEGTDTFERAKAFHGYITALRGARSSSVFNAIDNAFHGLDKATGGKLKLGRIDSRDASSFFQQFTAHVIVLGRPLYQVVQNAVQLLYVGMRDPINGPLTAGQIPILMPNLLGLTDDVRIASIALGVSKNTTRELIKEIKASGLMEGVGRADDFLQLATLGKHAPATSTAGAVGKAVAGTAKAPFRASRYAQEGVIKLVNLAAYLTEFNRLVRGKGLPYNAITKRDISFNAQRMTQTQNGINQFVYQNKNNAASMMLQFMQHVHKIFLDVVADPAWKAFKGKNIGNIPSIFSESRAQAFFTVGSVLTMFGISGIFGEKVGTSFGDIIRSIDPDIDESVLEVFVNGGLINSFANAVGSQLDETGKGGRVDVSGKMGPSAFIDMFSDFYLNDPGTVDLLGATGQVAVDVADRTYASYVIGTTSELDTSEKVSNILRELGGIVKGVSDAEKAWIAYHMYNFPYTKTLSSGLRVEQMEAYWLMLNIQPELVSNYFNSGDFSSGKSSKSSVTKMSEIFMRALARDLATQKDDNTLDILTATDTAHKYINILKNLTDPTDWPEIDREFRSKALISTAPTYQKYIKPYVDEADMGDIADNLRILLQKAENEDARAEIQKQIEFYEMFEEHAAKIYGVDND